MAHPKRQKYVEYLLGILGDVPVIWDLLRHDDSRIGRFLRSRAINTVYPCPSLVQHRDDRSLVYSPDEVPFIRKALFYDGDKK